MHCVKYFLSEKGRKESLKLGESGERVQTVTVKDLHGDVMVPADLLQVFFDLCDVDVHGNATLHVGGLHYITGSRYQRSETGYKIVTEWSPSAYDVYGYKIKEENVEFDVPQSIDALILFEQGRKQAISEDAEFVIKAEVEQLNKIEAPKKAKHLAQIIEKEKAEERLEADRIKANDETKERKKKEKEKAYQEAAEWINDHGTHHLQAIVEEDLLGNSMKMYQDERLRKEMPGWRFLREIPLWNENIFDSDIKDPMNPTEEQISWLREQRTSTNKSNIRLAFISLDIDGYVDDHGNYLEPIKVREMVLVSTFLGEDVVIRQDT